MKTMRRSICYTEPSVALAGDGTTWNFIYTTANQLPKGTKIRFDLGSKGRPFDWQIPQTQLKEKLNVIWGELGGKILPATAADSCFDFTLPQELKPGEQFSIHIGSTDKDPAKKGNLCQRNVQRRRPFHLYIDPKGKGEFKEPELFHIDVRGNKLHALKIIAPSLVSRNKRFDLIVRFEDVYGNLTSHAPDGTLIDLSYEHLRENLNWKLFVPETGFIAIPNLYFNEVGIYKIKLHNLRTKELFFSSPIKCLPEGALNLYWGLLHGESERIDSAENVESFLRHIRDDKSFQYCATSSFDSEEETPNDTWKQINAHVAEFNEDDRFVAFLGFHWLGEPKEEGLRHFLFSKDSKAILRRKDIKNNALKKIYKTNSPKEFLAIPSFTAAKTTLYDFEQFNPEFERVVEIYNAWGSSENTSKEGNLRPIQGGKTGIAEAPEGTLVRALNRGCRFGFIAGGLDDRSCYSDLFDTTQAQYSPGLTAILAKEHSRASLFEALQARSCYATTGERIILGLYIAKFPMGSELDTKSRPGLEFNRHITGFCIGTQPLDQVILIRNGKPFRTFEVKEEKLEFEIDDTDLLGDISLEPTGEGRSPFVYYYLRAVQKDGHIAWSSPIWVDLTSKSAPITGTKKTKKRS